MLVICGLNHESAPEEIRARGAFIKREILETLGELIKTPQVREALILSTCNRSEIVIFIDDTDLGEKLLRDTYSKKDPILSKYLYTYTDKDALRHLFELACGLDSMVIGEDQIVTQLREALEFSENNGYSGKFLNQFVREAITFSKRIKTVYKISQVPRSLSATAVKILKRRYPDYNKKRVLIVGSGKMGLLALRHLAAEGFESITMTNRTYHPGDEYREIYAPIRVIDYRDRYEHLKNTDIVISATSSPHTIFESGKMPPIENELVFLDLALPMDVDREIDKLENVEVIGIDAFRAYISEKEDWQSQRIAEIKKEIEPAVENTIEWVEHTGLDSIVSQLNASAREQAEETIKNLNKRYNFSGKDLKYLEKIVRSGFSNLVKPTLLKLKQIDSRDEREIIKEAVEVLSQKEIVRKKGIKK